MHEPPLCGWSMIYHPLVRGEEPMYAVPDVEEVVAVAKELGIHLGPEEAVLYRKYLLEQLQEFATFVQAGMEEPSHPWSRPLGSLGTSRAQTKTHSTPG